MSIQTAAGIPAPVFIGMYGFELMHRLISLQTVFTYQPGKRQIHISCLSHMSLILKHLVLADEMGFLVVDEAFDMWERSKTTYDYARFFKTESAKDVKSWICRDRNHPCIIMWSIGNEIYDTHVDERGMEITQYLLDEVKKYDPRENAAVTIGSNYMPWENVRKCADIVKLAGYNYAEKLYQKHHEKHPDWMIYGSETSSVVQSRGIYHFPLKTPILCEDNEQCSSLGNSTTSWGAKSMESCILAERDTVFSMGQFIWTGFDYMENLHLIIPEILTLDRLIRQVFQKTPFIVTIRTLDRNGHQSRTQIIVCT
jgi:hypothetical protein